MRGYEGRCDGEAFVEIRSTSSRLERVGKELLIAAFEVVTFQGSELGRSREGEEGFHGGEETRLEQFWDRVMCELEETMGEAGGADGGDEGWTREIEGDDWDRHGGYNRTDDDGVKGEAEEGSCDKVFIFGKNSIAL